MAANIFVDMPGGVKIPAIGLGTWSATDEAELEKALNVALEVGYRHIDTAFVYENESVIGRVLKQWLSSGKLKREDLFITTKLPLFGVHKDRVELFLKKSLEKLQLDYVDLYLIHFPAGTKYVEGSKSLLENLEPELDTDHIAVWKKLEEQVDAGRTKTIGLSNFNVRQIEKILKSSRIQPACLQIELNIHLQQRELVNYCQKNKIVVVAYGPLGSPGYNKFVTTMGREAKKLPDILNDPVVKRVAQKHKKTNAQVVLRYLIQKNIVPIPKSVSPARLKENIGVFDFSLDTGDVKSLYDLEVGEDARIFEFEFAPRLKEHPEWPLTK